MDYGTWETIRLNPYDTSMNISLYVTGLTTLNNAATGLWNHQ
jgi:hypothetical protein